MGALITIALIAVVAHLWRRLNLLQARVDQLETHDFSYAAVEPAALRASELVEPDVPVEVSPVASFEPADVEPPGVEKSSILTAETQEIEDSQLEELHDEPDEPSSGFSFEDIFGRRLPIWAGGITLAIAGM